LAFDVAGVVGFLPVEAASSYVVLEVTMAKIVVGCGVSGGGRCKGGGEEETSVDYCR
jgi:hypothetical protein